LPTLSCAVDQNPWAQKYGLTLYRLQGVVTNDAEDAEGNRFTPDRQTWDGFCAHGYLDIDHAYFSQQIEDAVIGVPEIVEIFPHHVTVTFRLLNRPDTAAIYAYTQDHPNLLGFSIAGPLQKDILDHNGTWPGIDSVALTHAPINAETNAVALSRMSLRLALNTAHTLATEPPAAQSVGAWRTWFLAQGWDLLPAHQLAIWAQTQFQHRVSMQATPVMKGQLLDNLLVPPEALENIADRVVAHCTQWRTTHPLDVHFEPDGRFYSAAQAIEHFRRCEGYSKEQVAHILGVIRDNANLIIHPPGSQFTQKLS